MKILLAAVVAILMGQGYAEAQPPVSAKSLVGQLPALDGSELRNISAGYITAGGTLPVLSGQNLTNLPPAVEANTFTSSKTFTSDVQVDGIIYSPTLSGQINPISLQGGPLTLRGSDSLGDGNQNGGDVNILGGASNGTNVFGYHGGHVNITAAGDFYHPGHVSINGGISAGNTPGGFAEIVGGGGMRPGTARVLGADKTIPAGNWPGGDALVQGGNNIGGINSGGNATLKGGNTNSTDDPGDKGGDAVMDSGAGPNGNGVLLFKIAGVEKARIDANGVLSGDGSGLTNLPPAKGFQIKTKAEFDALTPAFGDTYYCSDCTIPYDICTATGTDLSGFRAVMNSLSTGSLVPRGCGTNE